MSRTRYQIYEKDQPHFMTCTIVGWLPIFTRPDTMDIVLDSWRFLQKEGRLKLYGYVILENHLHMVASAEDLSKEIGAFKSFTARTIIDYLVDQKVDLFLKQLRSLKKRHKADRDFQLWQEGSHPQQILSDEMMIQKLEYIHMNPVKRGFIDEAEHWRYSSARNYLGKAGLIEVATSWRD
jgi:putative transposase